MVHGVYNNWGPHLAWADESIWPVHLQGSMQRILAPCKHNTCFGWLVYSRVDMNKTRTPWPSNKAVSVLLMPKFPYFLNPCLMVQYPLPRWSSAMAPSKLGMALGFSTLLSPMPQRPRLPRPHMKHCREDPQMAPQCTAPEAMWCTGRGRPSTRTGWWWSSGFNGEGPENIRTQCPETARSYYILVYNVTVVQADHFFGLYFGYIMWTEGTLKLSGV